MFFSRVNQTGSLLIAEMAEELGIVLVGKRREGRNQLSTRRRQDQRLKSPVSFFNTCI